MTQNIYQQFHTNIILEANKDTIGTDYSPDYHCLNAVENALEKTFLFKAIRPEYAFQFIEAYKSYKPFLKYFIGPINGITALDSYPLLTIAVYNKERTHPYGHIEVKTGYPSRWTSDYTQKNRVSYGTQNKPWSVFLPLQKNTI